MSALQRAISAHQSGKFVEAERLYRRMIASGRNSFQAKHLLGVLYFQRGNLEDANRLLRQALMIKADDDAAHYNYGMVLHALKQHGDALVSFNKAIMLNPANAGAFNNRGVVLVDLKQYDQAIASYNKAIAFNPTFIEAKNNRDIAVAALLTLGNELFAQNHDAEALVCYDKLIAAIPDQPDAHYNKGLVKLSLGDYAEGWPLFEWRWKLRTFASFVRDYGPLWQGDDDLSGKTILIHADQGIGDAIQMFRYLPLLKARGCRVIFEVHKPLVSLFTGYGIDVIARRDVPPTADAFPPFDFHCPLFSLPLAFNTTLDTIPTSPYLDTPPDSMQLGQKTKPRIGIVWAGNPQFHNDLNRSIKLEALLPIMVDEVEWFSLQKDVRDRDRVALNYAPLRDLTETLNDFADTAALISQLDVVISVDTAVAHLAGALGKPVWLMLPFHPDWRWMRERTDSPWYQTIKLFRQTEAGVWTDVLDHLSVEISKIGR